MRATRVTLCLMICLAAPAATALEATLMSAPSVIVNVGGTFTIDLAIDNANVDEVNAVEVLAKGLFAMSGLVIGGRAARDILVQSIPAGGFFGIPAVDNAFIDPDDFTNTAPPAVSAISM